MNSNLIVLNHIFKNTTMGIESIETVEKNTDDGAFLDLIMSQKQNFIKFNDDAREKIRAFGQEPQDINAFAKVSSNFMINAKSMINNTPSALAEMMINGTNMGIVDLKRTLNENEMIDSSIKRFSDRLMSMEENHINDLKAYL